MTKATMTATNPAADRADLMAAVERLTKEQPDELTRDQPVDENPSDWLQQALHDAITRAERLSADLDNPERAARAWEAVDRYEARIAEHEKRHTHATTVRHIRRPSLIDQLRAAVETSKGGLGGPRGKLSTRDPIGLAALDLLERINQGTRDHPGDRRDTLVGQVRAWAAQAGAWRTTDPDRLRDAAEQAARWQQAAEELLDPTIVPMHGATCSHCGAQRALVDRDGEKVRQPALALDTSAKTVTCRNCGSDWVKDFYERLAEQQRQEAVAAFALLCAALANFAKTIAGADHHGKGAA